MNLIIQVGNLSQDVVLTRTNSGTPVVNCSIATNRSIPKPGGEGYTDEVTFVPFTIWGKRAEAFAKYHQKGSKACLTGRMTLDTWEDRATGQQRSKLKMIAEEWEFVEPKSRTVSDSTSPQVLSDEPTPF